MSKQALDNATRKNAFGLAPEKLTIISLDTDDGQEHPLWDPRVKLPVDEGVVQSLIAYGFAGTILVRKDGDKTVVIDGRQRVRAARIANERLKAAGKDPIEVVCIVRRSDDDDASGLANVLNRARIDDDPVTLARKAQRALDRGKTLQAVAVDFAMDKGALGRLLKILDCDDKVLKAVQSGTLSQSAAAMLAELPRAEQVSKLDEILSSGVKATVAEVRRVRKAREAGASNGHDEGPGKKVSVQVLRKVSSNEDFLGGLSTEAAALLKWVLTGDLNQAKRVKGLTGVLKDIGVVESSDAAE